eukprot:8602207-Pyramimonas_sp.AAC.1
MESGTGNREQRRSAETRKDERVSGAENGGMPLEPCQPARIWETADFRAKEARGRPSEETRSGEAGGI